MTFENDINRHIEEMEAANDAAGLQALLAELYEEAPTAAQPFDAAIALRPEVRERIDTGPFESDAVVGFANRISRAKRRVDYRLKTMFGFDGLKIVDEGDSWHQYPLLLKDLVDHLNEDADRAIFSLSAGGDLVADMAARAEYLEALETTDAPVMLLSGGGNDLLGDGRFAEVLRPYEDARSPEELINFPKLERQESRVLAAYTTILSQVRQRFPAVQVFGHAYDLPFVAENGDWLGKPLAARGIPLEMGRDIVKIVLDRFSRSLEVLQGQFPNYTFVSLRDSVGNSANSWYDELHPKSPGFGRAAARMAQAIDAHVAGGGLEMASTRGLAPGAEFEAASSTIVLDPGHGGTTPPQKVGGSSWNNAFGPRGTLEKTLTLDVARRAKVLLEARGHTVLLTRSTDRNLSLKNRAKVAKDANAEVFISIHFNASTNHNAQGTETFVHPQHINASATLCRAVQASMVMALSLRDRNAGHPDGVKIGSYGVLRRSRHAATTAAVLHEVSFMDRADEEIRLLTTGYREKIAKALADGIEDYLGGALEPFDGSQDPEELGDAIEFEAMRRGVPVNTQLGLAEAPVAWTPATAEDLPMPPVGGDALAAPVPGLDFFPERPGTLGNALAGQIAESIALRQTAIHNLNAGEHDDETHEFSGMDVGEGFIVPDASGGFESSIQHSFSNLSSGGFDLARFEAFIDSFGLRWFQPAEFLYPGSGNATGKCAGRNTPPPEHLWPNIANTAILLDRIRDRLGVPVRITSCYRSPAYNSCIGGASASQHVRFNAIDWTAAAGSVADWHAAAVAVRSSEARFRGGIGKYVSQRFIHVDTRGHQADWSKP